MDDTSLEALTAYVTDTTQTPDAILKSLTSFLSTRAAIDSTTFELIFFQYARSEGSNTPVWTVASFISLLRTKWPTSPTFADEAGPILYVLALTWGYYPFPAGRIEDAKVDREALERAVMLLAVQGAYPKLGDEQGERVVGLTKEKVWRVVFDALASSGGESTGEEQEGDYFDGHGDVLDVVTMLQPAFAVDPVHAEGKVGEACTGGFVAEMVHGLPCRVVDHEATVKVDDFTMLMTISKVGSREVARWRKEREETEWLVPHILDVDLTVLKKQGLSWGQFRLCCTSLEAEMMDGVSELFGLLIGGKKTVSTEEISPTKHNPFTQQRGSVSSQESQHKFGEALGVSSAMASLSIRPKADTTAPSKEPDEPIEPIEAAAQNTPTGGGGPAWSFDAGSKDHDGLYSDDDEDSEES